MNYYDIVREPRITEKSVYQRDALNTYTFKVHKSANKTQIKEAVEKLFAVKVENVNVMNCSGKKRRVGRSVGFAPNWKKALVTLADGNEIEEA